PDVKFPVIYTEKGIIHVRLESETKNFKASPVSISIKGGDKAYMVPSVCKYSVIVNDPLHPSASESISSSVHGRSSHASLPQYGENAISKAISEISGWLKDRNISHPFIDFYSEKIALRT